MILIIDDEKNIRRTLAMVVEGEGFTTETAGSGEEGISALKKSNSVDTVFLDVMLPGINGLEALKQIKALDPHVEVIMLSGHASLTDAVEATRLGAFDFLEKPLDRERVLLTLRNSLAKRTLSLKLKAISEDNTSEMLGESAPIQALRQKIGKVAPTRGRVLIQGESGTGKELVARAIHQLSARSSAPFIKVNCAAIPDDLIESELFGHERGSFSGATNRKRGKFELADNGTLFLDEIGDMSLSAQAKVLRALQSGEIYRVGSEQPLVVDARVIAATNKNLQEAIQNNTFREDLFFRLNVVPLKVPRLAERSEDIPLLTTAFVQEFCSENGMRHKTISTKALNVLSTYHWPGNIRELKNICERLVIMSGETIDVSDIPEHISPSAANSTSFTFDALSGSLTLKAFRELAERHFIEGTLRTFGWNVTRAAETLGIERTNLHKKIKALGIQRGPSS